MQVSYVLTQTNCKAYVGALSCFEFAFTNEPDRYQFHHLIQLQGFRFLRSWSVEAYAIKGRKEYAAHRIAQQTRDAYEEEGSTVANSQELNDRHETEREERGVEDRYSEQWESIPTNGREDGWCVGERRDAKSKP